MIIININSYASSDEYDINNDYSCFGDEYNINKAYSVCGDEYVIDKKYSTKLKSISKFYALIKTKKIKPRQEEHTQEEPRQEEHTQEDKTTIILPTTFPRIPRSEPIQKIKTRVYKPILLFDPNKHLIQNTEPPKINENLQTEKIHHNTKRHDISFKPMKFNTTKFVDPFGKTPKIKYTNKHTRRKR